jgi:Outer membrane protein beta-barrel domain
MFTPGRLLVFVSFAALTTYATAQVAIGGKVGANYAIGSMKIQPNPKDPPTNPKGLGLQFGAYAEIPFSDMVGLRPELAFSFRRMKTENTVTNDNYQEQTNQGTFQGKLTQVTETDQRLTYFQVNSPLTLSPSEGFRVMFGPSFNFLMGGKQNEDITTTYKGEINGQNTEGESFSTSEKKGSSATKDFRKADVAAMAGVGYTLDAGFDMDLRFYRSISTTYDQSEGSSRFRIWTNLIEFSVGWTFGR